MRRIVTLGSISAVVVAALVQLTAAHAETATLAAPYRSDAESCVGNGTCDAAADAATGDLRVDAAAVGTFDTYTFGDAAAEVVAVHALGAKADRIDYTVNFDVLEAVAQTAGETSLMADRAIAAVRLVAWAEHTDCQECWSPRVVRECRASFLVADVCRLPVGRVPLAVTLTNGAGGPVPAGTVVISARLEGYVKAAYCDLPLVCEASATGRASVASIVAESNNFPVAVDDSASALQGSPVTIKVLANDFDPDGDPLSVGFDWSGRPAHGTAAVNPDQTVTYTPNPCFVGTDTFTYYASDGKGGYDRGVVTVRLRKARSSGGC